MARKMLIDAAYPEETRVVVLHGNRLEEFDYETESRKQLKGNVYLAKITRVEPSLQAAFVEYGGNRHGFLAFNEIHPDYYQIPVADREKLIAEEHPVAEERETGNGEPVDVVGGDEFEEVEHRRSRVQRYKIQEVIKRRQIMLVQVVKEERGNKGAALTTYLSLPGRYCVLMPNTGKGGGISRKITNATDRKRLKSVIEDLNIPEGMAVILRTAGSERSKAEIRRDYDYLLRLWDEIRTTTLESTAPSLIYEEANLIKRAIRDLYSKDIEEILIDGDDGYRAAKDFMKALMPSHARRVQRYKSEGVPLFQRYQVEVQLDGIHSPEVQLKSGGYIVIHQTEALVAVDVNSGRATRERHIEETALKTNLEAADEVARQVRLRDLAGLIVIDFIDMEESRNNHAVERRFKEALRNDRARIQVGRISHFGLLEMSRQRLRPSLMEISSMVCHHCQGTGFVRSVEWTGLYMLRAIEEEGIRQRASWIKVMVPSEVALFILNQKRKPLAEIEARYNFTVTFEADDTLTAPNYRIEVVGTRERPEPEEEEEAAAPTAPVAEENGGDPTRKRRRRRRRGRRDDEAPEGEERPAAADADREEEDAEGEAHIAAADDEDDEEGEEARPQAAAGGEDDDAGRKRRRRGRRGGRRRGRRRDGEDMPAAEAEAGEAGSTPQDGDAIAADAVAAPAETPADRDSPAEPTDEPVAAAADAEEAPALTEDPVEATEPTPEPAEEPTAIEAEAEAPAVAAPPARKRAPRRKAAEATGTARSRRKAAPKAEAAAEAASPPKSEPEPEPATEARSPDPEPAPASPAPAPAAAEPAAAEPAPEPAAEPETAEPSAPKRSGWWNRVLG